ncbi:3-deoxy-manno-octulosonate cytidylyltransferase family protein [Sphingomonas sp. GB1N7]|uniref:3-deoxy-manno-octulosonate cytidylyltransferase family protein n=1 Tax=Parasphingomonas caseinilytica TaxID=3096158 RepID=UPI002FCC73B8
MTGIVPPFTIIIPARFQSSRYPGKPLVPLIGATGEGKSLIERSWTCAQSVPGARAVYVATDDARIADAVRDFGGEVVMTAPECRNGTERCAEAVATLGLGNEIVVNLQGDAPLTPSFVIPDLVAALTAEPGAAMATVALRTSASTYAHLIGDAAAGRVGGTTVVTTASGRALYFSKRVLPFVPPALDAIAHEQVRLHLGVYAYRCDALADYAAKIPSALEELEGLEQLRFLESDAPIRVVTFESVGWDCIELNNPGDVPAIEAVLAARGIA